MQWTVVGGMLAILLIAGCTTAPEGPGADEIQPVVNIWEAGLSDHYDTPAVALTRSSEERRADMAAPGDAAYAGFDQAMLAYMQRYGIPAGSLALMHDGDLLYTSGYGYTKPDGTGPTDPNTMFRMASVTKPITHALVTLQVEQGLYSWDHPVFCLPPEPDPDCRLPLTPHPDHPVVDERIADITVGMLLDHAGGWGPSQNHLYKLEGIQAMQELFGIEGMPQRWHVGTYLMGTELVNDPGVISYCNMCYLLAGLVAEAATGVELQALYDAYLFRPLDIEGDIELGKMPLDERNPREPFYISDEEGPSVYDPNETVNAADGAYSIEINAANGGLIGTSEAVAAVYEAYPAGLSPSNLFVSVAPIDPYDLAYENRVKHGGQEGTSAVSWWAEDIRTDTGVIQFVVLFNADFVDTRGCLTQDGANCPGWVDLRNELFLMLAEKARER